MCVCYATILVGRLLQIQAYISVCDLKPIFDIIILAYLTCSVKSSVKKVNRRVYLWAYAINAHYIVQTYYLLVGGREELDKEGRSICMYVYYLRTPIICVRITKGPQPQEDILLEWIWKINSNSETVNLL